MEKIIFSHEGQQISIVCNKDEFFKDIKDSKPKSEQIKIIYIFLKMQRKFQKK